ncbi:cytoskeleton-associated protein 2-like [Neosynchiropus ocellatus]
MEAEVTVPARKELRRRKMMEYLAAKGKRQLSSVMPLAGVRLKEPPKYPHQISKGKENQAPPSVSSDSKKAAVPPIWPRPAGKVLSARKHNEKNSNPKQLQESRKTTAVSDSTKVHNRPAHSRTSAAAGDHQRKELSVQVPSSRKTLSNVMVAPRDSHRGPPANTFTSRVTLGPIVKTRTGLTPAVIIPQNRRTIATLAVRSSQPPGASRLQPHGGSVVSVSKSSSTVQSFARKNPITKKPTDTHTAAKHQGQPRPVWQRPRESQQSIGLKPAFTSAQRSQASGKGNGEAAGQLRDGSRKPRSDAAGQRHPQSKSAPSGPGLLPASRPHSRVTVNPAVQQRGKPGPRSEAEGKTSLASVRARQLTAGERKSAPVMTRTARKPSAVTKATATPAAPAGPRTAVQMMSTVQVERMTKLQEWREAKGISYKRPSMHIKPKVRCSVAEPESFGPKINEEEEVHSVISAVDGSLSDCIKLLEEGCSPDRVKEIIDRLPAVSQNFAKFWICRALLMERQGNLDVLPMFEEAVGVVLEPVDELRAVVFQILQRRDKMKEVALESEKQPPVNDCDPMVTPPKAVGALIYGETGNSSVVKYKITATPGQCPPSQQKAPSRVNGQEVRFFTPVRRSVRIERASLRLPASLQDHDLCVSSFNDLMAKEEQEGGASPDHQERLYVYRENEALEDKVTIQLVHEAVTQPAEKAAAC